jgi:hypothetical protein
MDSSGLWRSGNILTALFSLRSLYDSCSLQIHSLPDRDQSTPRQKGKP